MGVRVKARRGPLVWVPDDDSPLGQRSAFDPSRTKDVEVELTYDPDADPDWGVVHVHGGPTGHESFCVNPEDSEDHPDNKLLRMCESGWTPCMGTVGRWDRLEISAEEMARGLTALGLVEDRDDE